MEELNLEDLNFDMSNSLFNEDGTAVNDSKPEEDGTNPGDTAGAADDTPGADDKNINPDGDGTDDSGQEIVANQGKDNQVQAGKTSTDGDGGNSSSPKLNETEQLYSNLAAQFKAKGVLPGLENVEDIKSLEDLNKALEKEVASRLDSTQTTIKEAMSVGAPVEEVAEMVQTIDKLESIDPAFIENDANIEFRRNAIVQDFVDKGYGDERARVLAQRSIDAGTDIEDAKFAIKNIIATEKKNLADIIQAAKNKENNSLNDIKNYISSTPEVIPGIQLTNSQKDELYNQMTTQVNDAKDNAFMAAQKADPIGSRIKLEALFYVTKGLTDFSVFGNKTETKISQNIENLIRGAKFTEQGQVQTQVEDKDSNFILSDLKGFEIE
jgi:hypothetical protein